MRAVTRSSWIAAAAIAAMVAACSGPWIPAATEADAARTSTSLEALQRGRTLLVNRCGACHITPSPRDHQAADWPEQVEAMRERAKLTPEDASAVTRYLTAFASDVSR